MMFVLLPRDGRRFLIMLSDKTKKTLNDEVARIKESASDIFFKALFGKSIDEYVDELTEKVENK